MYLGSSFLGDLVSLTFRCPDILGRAVFNVPPSCFAWFVFCLPPHRAGLGAQRLDHLQPPEAVRRTAPLLPRPRSARPGLLSQLPLPLLPVQARSVLRLGSKWMWESRLRAGDLGEAFGARSVQRPLEDESGGGPRPTPSSCRSRRGRRSIRAPPQSLVGDKRGHEGGQREDEGMINLSDLVSRSQDSAPVLPGKESGRQGQFWRLLCMEPHGCSHHNSPV